MPFDDEFVFNLPVVVKVPLAAFVNLSDALYDAGATGADARPDLSENAPQVATISLPFGKVKELREALEQALGPQTESWVIRPGPPGGG